MSLSPRRRRRTTRFSTFSGCSPCRLEEQAGDHSILPTTVTCLSLWRGGSGRLAHFYPTPLSIARSCPLVVATAANLYLRTLSLPSVLWRSSDRRVSTSTSNVLRLAAAQHATTHAKNRTAFCHTFESRERDINLVSGRVVRFPEL